MKLLQNLCIVIFCCTWSLGQEAGPDKTVPAEPVSVLPPSVQKSPQGQGPEQPTQSQQPSQGQQNDGLYGTTHETKNPDGSITSVTHFKGQLPPNSFSPNGPFNAGFHPGAFPGFGYPGASPFFYNPWGPPITPAHFQPQSSPNGFPPQSPNGFAPQPPQNVRSKRAIKSNESAKSKKTGENADSVASQVTNSSSLLFSNRFPAPSRESNSFHYPELPEVYWSKHKRPYVPLLDPEIYGNPEVEHEKDL